MSSVVMTGRRMNSAVKLMVASPCEACFAYGVCAGRACPAPSRTATTARAVPWNHRRQLVRLPRRPRQRHHRRRRDAIRAATAERRALRRMIDTGASGVRRDWPSVTTRSPS